MTKTKNRKKQRNASKPAIKEKPLLNRQVEIGLLVAVLLLVFGLRMIRIDSPLVDFHAHRQTQTASNTRSFANVTMNLFQPRFLQIDAEGNAPGMTEMEFPIYQYIIGMTYRVVGEHEFLGRFFAVLLGVGVAFYTYLLARRYFGAIAALGAAFFYAINPVGVFFNRTFQPDTLALLAFIGGIYHLAVWFDDRTRRQLYLAIGLTSLGLLIKPPVIVILAPWILYELYRHRFWESEQRKDLWRFMAGAAIIGGVTAAWYIYTDIFIFQKSGLTMIRGKVGDPIRTTEYWFSAMLYRETIARIILILTPIGAAIFAAALIPLHLAKRGKFMTALLIGYLLYFILVAEYNLPHYYYQLPFVPIAAIYAGWALSWAVEQAKKSEAALMGVPIAIILLIGGIGAMSWNTASPWYNVDHAPYILEPAAKLREFVQPEERVMANSPFFASFYYYSNTNMPYIKWFEETQEFNYYIWEYDPAGDWVQAPSRVSVGMELGVKYVVWLKAFPPGTHGIDQNITEKLPENAELLSDARTYSIWRLP